MSGTKIGGIKCAQKNKKLYGDDFYKRIGAKGGKAGHTGGFAANPALAKLAGHRAGSVSKRGYKLLKVEGEYGYYICKATGKIVKLLTAKQEK